MDNNTPPDSTLSQERILALDAQIKAQVERGLFPVSLTLEEIKLRWEPFSKSAAVPHAKTVRDFGPSNRALKP